MRKKNKVTPLTRSNRRFFQTFYEEYKGFLLYIADRYAENMNDREDLVQECWLRLIRNADILRQLNRSQTAKYIELTVKTAFLDMEQTHCRERLLVLDKAAIDALLDLKSDDEPEVFANLAIKRLKSSLSRRDWLVLEGKYVLGYTYEELARILGESEDSLRSLVSRARKRARYLLRDLEEEGDGSDA